MNALAYLLFTRFKNTLTNLYKKPARLIFAIVILALLVLVFVVGGEATEHARDVQELYAMVFALFFILLAYGAYAGLRSGASLFTMPDVNFLFCGPFSSQKLLVYGLVRQLSAILLMALFLLFQYAWLSMTYGVTPLGLLLIIVGYVLLIFCSQLLAMVIYIFSSSDPKRQRIIKMLLYGFVALVLVFAAVSLVGTDNPLPSLVAAVNSPLFYWIPLAGWLEAFTVGVFSGNGLLAAAGLGATALFVFAFVIIINKLNADYYEDVLAATESSFSAVAAAKEGKMAETAGYNVKVGKIGLARGQGATAFYYKHLLENRRARVFLFDKMSLIVMATSIAFAFFFREDGLVPGLVFSIYMMMFASFTGRWVRELLQPYVYMVPEKPFRKMLTICAETMRKSIVESILIVVIMGLIASAGPIEIVLAVIVRIAAAALFIAANFLTERLFGTIPQKMLQLLFYFIVLLVLAAPGIVGMVFAAIYLGSLAAYAVIAVWLLFISVLVSFICRNILVYAELNNV